MVNVGLSWSSFLGIALAVAGASLYFLRSMRPKLARDHDIFFAAVGLLCGGILFFQGWRQDPILQFGQFLLTGTTIFFAVESIRLRGVATEQAKRNSPIVDDDRPVSPVYRYQAEFEELNYDDRTTPRRIRGTKEARPARDEYEEGGTGARRRPSSRTNPDDRPAPGEERPRRRPRPRPEQGPTDYPETPEDVDNVQENKPARPPRSGSRSSSRSPNQAPGARPRRPRPTGEEPSETRPRNNRPSDAEPPSSEYVDYRPVDKDEEDNWGEY